MIKSPLGPWTVALGILAAPLGALAEDLPAEAAVFSSYGAWDLRLERLERAPNGDWQAVVLARDAAADRTGMGRGQVFAALLDAEGRTFPSDRRLYRPGARAASPGDLEAIWHMIRTQAGQTVRVRLVFPNSAELRPTQVRLTSNARQPVTRTFALANQATVLAGK